MAGSPAPQSIMVLRAAGRFTTLTLSIPAWQGIVGNVPTIWDQLIAALVCFLIGVGGGALTRRLR